MSRTRETRAESNCQVLRRLVALAPHDKELRLRLAKGLLLAGGFEEALDQIRAVLRLDPNNLLARELRLRIHEGDAAARSAAEGLTPQDRHIVGEPR